MRYHSALSPASELQAFTREQGQHLLRHLAWFLQRQKVFVIVTTLAVTLMTATMSYLIDPVYTATAAVVVERSRNPLLRDETERPVTSIELANDLRDIIRSRPVIEAVVDKLRPYDRPRRQSSVLTAILDTLDELGLFSLPPVRERYIRRWTKSLLVDADGDYVTLSLADEDPEIASAVLSSIVEIQQRRYVDLLRTLHGSNLRREMLTRVQTEMTSLHDALANLSTPSANSNGYAAALAELGAIRRMASASDDQVSALRMRLGPDYPDTVAAQQTSTALQDALSALSENLQALERSAVRSEETRLLIRSHAATVESIRKSLDQSEMLEQSDTRTVSLRIAEEALPPIAPIASRLLQLAIGFGAGLAFAVGAAFIRDRLRAPLVSVVGVENILQSPVQSFLKDSRGLARRLRAPG